MKNEWQNDVMAESYSRPTAGIEAFSWIRVRCYKFISEPFGLALRAYTTDLSCISCFFFHLQ